MLNSVAHYYELGQKVAIAANQKDESRIQFHRRHFKECIALENEQDKKKASSAFDEGYFDNRNTPKVEYFK